MKRNIDLKDITDGRFYQQNDLVKAGCQDCKACSACCKGMGNSIILDPFDIYQLTMHLRVTFEELLQDRIELNIVDGIIMPNLRMAGEEERCVFLNSEGRCSIHISRPGLCRLFPLGRYYEDHAFQYILQVNECVKANKTKVKISKWVDVPEIKCYEQFVLDWHEFLMKTQEILKKTQDDKRIKEINLSILGGFYQKPYESTQNIYTQLFERIIHVGETIFNQKDERKEQISCTTHELVFRKAIKDDIDQVYQVFKDAIREMDQNQIPQWDEQYPNRIILSEDISKGQMVLGCVEGKIASVYVLNQECDEQYRMGNWSNPNASYRVIHRLCVNPQFQKCGIGKETMQHIHKELKAVKIETVRLDAFSKNPFALRLYDKLGYTKVGEATWRKGLFYLMEMKL